MSYIYDAKRKNFCMKLRVVLSSLQFYSLVFILVYADSSNISKLHKTTHKKCTLAKFNKSIRISWISMTVRMIAMRRVARVTVRRATRRTPGVIISSSSSFSRMISRRRAITLPRVVSVSLSVSLLLSLLLFLLFSLSLLFLLLFLSLLFFIQHCLNIFTNYSWFHQSLWLQQGSGVEVRETDSQIILFCQ